MRVCHVQCVEIGYKNKGRTVDDSPLKVAGLINRRIEELALMLAFVR